MTPSAAPPAARRGGARRPRSHRWGALGRAADRAVAAIAGPAGLPPTDDRNGETGLAGMDPRIRERRDAVARRRGRRRLALVAGGAAVPCLALGGWLLLHTGLLAARVVTVSGNVHTSRAAVVAAAGLSGHPPLIDVNAGAASAAVERLPWVAKATVARHWPDAVTIVVVERVPRLAVARKGGGWAEVDDTGRVLATVASQPPGLIVLDAPVAPGRPGGALGPRAAPALAITASLPGALRSQVTSITEAANGQVRLHLAAPVALTVQFGDASQRSAKEEDVAALLAHVPLHAGDVIDVRVPGSPTVAGP